jgi:dihydrofolate reductase
VLRGDVAEEVRKLKEQVDGVILVDELRLMVFPVVLGTGKRLFGATSDKLALRLADSKIVGDGIAILTYERGR